MTKPINPLGTTGFYHTDVARDEHMAGALNRLRDQMSGRVALPDEFLYTTETAFTDHLRDMDGDTLADNWSIMDEDEKDFIRRIDPQTAKALDGMMSDGVNRG